MLKSFGVVYYKLNRNVLKNLAYNKPNIFATLNRFSFSANAHNSHKSEHSNNNHNDHNDEDHGAHGHHDAELQDYHNLKFDRVSYNQTLNQETRQKYKLKFSYCYLINF